MNKKSKLIIALSVVVVLLAGSIAGVMIWFFSPGVHRLFGKVHMEFSKSGYLMDAEGNILHPATLTVNGSSDSEDFQVSLTGIPDEEGKTHTSYYKDKGGAWELTVTNADLRNGSHIRGPKYIFYMEGSDLLTACVFSIPGKEGTFYFVMTDDAEAAYRQVMDTVG